jgi:hypothetical protein
LNGCEHCAAARQKCCGMTHLSQKSVKVGGHLCWASQKERLTL